MGKIKDVPIGSTFGKLTVIKKYTGPGKGAKWVCKCKCGKEIVAKGTHLRAGSYKTCGSSKCRVKDITGKRSGMLEVVKFSHMEGVNSYWICKCDCGNDTIVCACNLDGINTRSCGCKSNEFQEQTNLTRYGTKSSFQNEDVQKRFRENNIKKYGVEYPAQNLEIATKTAKSQKNTIVLKHWKTGREIVCTASYEQAVVRYLNENKIDFRWQDKVFNVIIDGKHRTYRPDLYLCSEKIWVEIKGLKRELGMKKYNYFHDNIEPSSELWDGKKLKSMGIL